MPRLKIYENFLTKYAPASLTTFKRWEQEAKDTGDSELAAQTTVYYAQQTLNILIGANMGDEATAIDQLFAMLRTATIPKIKRCEIFEPFHCPASTEERNQWVEASLYVQRGIKARTTRGDELSRHTPEAMLNSFEFALEILQNGIAGTPSFKGDAAQIYVALRNLSSATTDKESNYEQINTLLDALYSVKPQEALKKIQILARTHSLQSPEELVNRCLKLASTNPQLKNKLPLLKSNKDNQLLFLQAVIIAQNPDLTAKYLCATSAKVASKLIAGTKKTIRQILGLTADSIVNIVDCQQAIAKLTTEYGKETGLDIFVTLRNIYAANHETSCKISADLFTNKIAQDAKKFLQEQDHKSTAEEMRSGSRTATPVRTLTRRQQNATATKLPFFK